MKGFSFVGILLNIMINSENCLLQLLFSAALAVASAQSSGYAKGYDRPYTTPIPILKQIDRHNDDGSYSYG